MFQPVIATERLNFKGGLMKTRLMAFIILELLFLLIWKTPAAYALGSVDNGKKLFTSHCFVCHGVDGKGNGPAAAKLETKPRDLTNNAYMAKLSDRQIFSAVSEGGPGFHGSVFMPQWGKVMSADEIWDIVAHVRVLHRPASAQGDKQNGEKLFKTYCASCHGAGGKGDGPLSPVYSPKPQDLTDDKVMSAKSDQELFTAISQGGKAAGASQFMPGWGTMLNDEEIRDVIAYMRSLHKKA